MLQVNRWRIATGLASLMIILMVAPLGVMDAMAVFDGLIILLTIAFTIVGVEVQQRGGGRFDRLFTRLSVPEPIVVLAGVAVLLVVSIRQYIQIASPDLVEATASINPDARSRYAIVQNYSYVWGWLLILWGVRPQIDLRAWWIRHKREVLPIIGLMTAGAAMRLIWLDDYPNILNGDDGLIGWWARTMYTEAGSLS